MCSMPSLVTFARAASSAADWPSSVRMSYRALRKARDSRMAIRSGSSAVSSSEPLARGQAVSAWSASVAGWRPPIQAGTMVRAAIAASVPMSAATSQSGDGRLPPCTTAA